MRNCGERTKTMRLRNGKCLDDSGQSPRRENRSRSRSLPEKDERDKVTHLSDISELTGGTTAGLQDSNGNGPSDGVHSDPGISKVSSETENHIVTSGTKTKNAVDNDHRPHDKNIVLALKLGGLLLFLFYFVIPATLKLNPSILSEMVFLHRIRFPLFVDLTKPAQLGLNGTRNFRIQTTDDLTIGAWHILPENLHSLNVASGNEFNSLLQDGQTIIIYLHGNVGTRAVGHRLNLYKSLAKAGFHIITVDYRGFGDSEGYPSEEGLVEDALATFDWVKSRAGNSKVYLWGHSLGSGVAALAAGRACQRGTLPAGLVLEAPFTNIIDAVTYHPLSLPFVYMPYFTWVCLESMKYNGIYFNTDQNIRQVSVPLLLLHAKDDYIVPFKLGQKLYEAARSKPTEGSVHFVGFEAEHHYGHDNIYLAPDLMRIVRDFTNDRLGS